MAFIDVETVASNMLADSYYATLATTELPTKELDGKPIVTDALDVFIVTAAQINVEELLELLDSRLVNRKEVAARLLALSLAVNEDTTDVELYEALNKYDRNRELVSVAVQLEKSYVLETIELVDQRGDSAFYTAVKEDNVSAMKLLKELGATDYTSWALSEAAIRGYTDAMELLLQWGGATDFDMAVDFAARGGYTDALKLLKEWEDSIRDIPLEEIHEGYNRALTAAAGGGHIEAMKIIKLWGVDAYDWALERAAANGHLEAMELIRGWGVDAYDMAFQRAAANGQIAALKLLKEWADSQLDDAPVIKYDYDDALRHAAEGSHLEAMELLRVWGATKYAGALERITYMWTGGTLEAKNLLKEWIAQSE
jgi:hypothetical protein